MDSSVHLTQYRMDSGIYNSSFVHTRFQQTVLSIQYGTVGSTTPAWCTSDKLLSQRSKTRTSVADPGSASGGTYQCMQFLPFLSIFSYLFNLGHLSLLGLQTKTRRQSNSSTFSSFKSHNPETFMSSTASASVQLFAIAHKSASSKKWGI